MNSASQYHRWRICFSRRAYCTHQMLNRAVGQKLPQVLWISAQRESLIGKKTSIISALLIFVDQYAGWPTANSDIMVCRCSSIYCFYILLKVLYFPATLLPPSVIPPWFIWTVVPLLDPCRYTANIVMCDSKIPRASLKTVPLRLTTCWSHLWYIVEALQVQ